MVFSEIPCLWGFYWGCSLRDIACYTSYRFILFGNLRALFKTASYCIISSTLRNRCAIMRSLCVMCVPRMFRESFRKFRYNRRFVCYCASYVCVSYTCAIEAQNAPITYIQADTSADPIEPPKPTNYHSILTFKGHMLHTTTIMRLYRRFVLAERTG